MAFKQRKRSREKKLKKAEPRILGDLVMMEAAATLAIAEEDQDPERLKCAQFVLGRVKKAIANIQAHGLRLDEEAFTAEEYKYVFQHFPPTNTAVETH